MSFQTSGDAGVYVPKNFFDKIWHAFKTHVTSKEFKKKWKRRLIVLGIIGVFVLSLVIRDNIERFPYKKDDCITISGAQITGSGRYTGILRLNMFLTNTKEGTPDKIRVFTFTKLGYEYKIDLEYDGTSITVKTDMRKDKTLPDDERIVTTDTYESFAHIVEDGKDIYALIRGETRKNIYVSVRPPSLS